VLKNFKIFTVITGIFFFHSLFSKADDTFEGKQETPDMEALLRWVQDKRLVTVKELGGDLSISAEVRTEMQAANEKKNGVRQRGRHSATSLPTCSFDAEVNLMLDYMTDRTWASVRLEFDNDMGLVSGTVDKIALERAFLGGRIYVGDTFNFNASLGRNNLDNLFDSRIEFSSIFDGLLLEFSKVFEKAGDVFFNVGSFLINDRKYHFAYIGELSWYRMGGSCFYSKYSFVNWKKNYKNPLKDLPFNFRVSQWILGYQCTVTKWEKLLKVYCAGLLNHSAKKLELTGNRKANWGGYVGFSLGRILKKGDWAFDINYQFVGPQAIPGFDVGGITRGNAADVGFYFIEEDDGTRIPTTRETAVGFGNYKGFIVELLYAITGNLTVLNNFQMSNNLYDSIGPKMKYLQYEIEFIYAF
jgi:hypothetical protein